MKVELVICVYGDFKKGDIRIKLFKCDSMEQYRFQNILRDAGYDAVIFNLTDGDIENAN